MKIFLSSSGDSSRLVAEALHEWLPMVLHYAEPWFSKRDISAGSRWALEISESLDNTFFGILCLTRQSLESRWIHFEAGAISKHLSESAVIPYLFQLDVSDLGGPLSQFQAKKAEKDQTFEMIESINSLFTDPINSTRLSKQFNALWPEFEGMLQKIPGEETKTPVRPTEVMIEDLFVNVRNLSARFAALEDKLDANNLSDSGQTKMHRATLNAVKELVRNAEFLMAGPAKTPEKVKSAKDLAQEAHRQIVSIFKTEELSDADRSYAQKVLTRAEAILALSEKEEEESS